jgi:hypothetical protein
VVVPKIVLLVEAKMLSLYLLGDVIKIILRKLRALLLVDHPRLHLRKAIQLIATLPDPQQ